jgi:hypothetical protein
MANIHRLSDWIQVNLSNIPVVSAAVDNKGTGEVDISGFRRTLVIASVTDPGDDHVYFVVEHSADHTGDAGFADSDYTAVVLHNPAASGFPAVVSATDNLIGGTGAQTLLVDLDNAHLQRYLRVHATATDTGSDAVFASYIIPYDPYDAPVTQPTQVANIWYGPNTGTYTDNTQEAVT